MNTILSKTGALVTTVTVALFALFIIIDFPFGYYAVCMLLPVGYVMMSAGLAYECDDDRRVAAIISMTLAAVYMILVLLVYFSQTTTVNNEELDEQASRLIDFRRGGLIFNYDLLGYGMMALSTFFMGLTVKPHDKSDKWLKWLLIIHGAFFPGCLIMPMTGVFLSAQNGEHGRGGNLALLFWCAYFIPIGILAYKHFNTKNIKE